jgi:predicted P-loop ATPase
MARGLVPGTKVHTILIIVGGQGRMKSTLLRELVNGRVAGWDFFTDQGFRLDNKDGQMLIGSYHLCEWGESEHAKNPKAIDTIKAFLAQETDLFRPPFGRHIVRRPRRVVFFGTSNESAGLLHDTTGHRRFYICNIGRNVLNLNALHDMRLQLWAQILDLRNRHLLAARTRFTEPQAQVEYDATRWWYEAEEEAARADSLKPYVAENAFQEPIEDWVSKRKDPFRVMDVIKECLDIHQGQATMAVRASVTSALVRLGCTRMADGASVYVGGKQGRFWRPFEPATDGEI